VRASGRSTSYEPTKNELRGYRDDRKNANLIIQATAQTQNRPTPDAVPHPFDNTPPGRKLTVKRMEDHQ
jgi:hypothetical protein